MSAGLPVHCSPVHCFCGQTQLCDLTSLHSPAHFCVVRPHIFTCIQAGLVVYTWAWQLCPFCPCPTRLHPEPAQVPTSNSGAFTTTGGQDGATGGTLWVEYGTQYVVMIFFNTAESDWWESRTYDNQFSNYQECQNLEMSHGSKIALVSVDGNRLTLKLSWVRVSVFQSKGIHDAPILKSALFWLKLSRGVGFTAPGWLPTKA